MTPNRAAFITIKGRKEGLAAREWEYQLPYADGEELLDTIARQETIVQKTRFVVPTGTEGLMYEVDVFKGHLEGIVVAEVEFPSPDVIFTPASWIGKEVTEDRRFANSYLGKAIGPMVQELVRMCESGES